MGMRGAARSLNAAANAYEREVKRRIREEEKQRKQMEKMQEIERAAFEVKLFDEEMNKLKFVHKDCSKITNWANIRSLKPPKQPAKVNYHENQARTQLGNYRPRMFDKLSGKVEETKRKLVNDINIGIQRDNVNYARNINEYKELCKKWKRNQQVADKVLKGTLDGYEAAIDERFPKFDVQIMKLLQFEVIDKDRIIINFKVFSEEIVPSQTKTQLASGKLSIKQMPKGVFYDTYLNYVSGTVIRFARETFSLLPVKMVIVNATSDLLNKQTGHLEEQIICSVLIPRDTIIRLNFDQLVPSDAMNNFVHNMKFAKTKGFSVVSQVDFEN